MYRNRRGGGLWKSCRADAASLRGRLGAGFFPNNKRGCGRGNSRGRGIASLRCRCCGGAGVRSNRCGVGRGSSLRRYLSAAMWRGRLGAGVCRPSKRGRHRRCSDEAQGVGAGAVFDAAGGVIGVVSVGYPVLPEITESGGVGLGNGAQGGFVFGVNVVFVAPEVGGNVFKAGAADVF